MSPRFAIGILAPLVPGLCLALAGCADKPAAAPAAPPPTVTVSYPVEREVTDYAGYTARTAAVDSVELRARVSGHLEKVNFIAGAMVHKGDVLFEIDPRPYQASLDKAKGELILDEARLKLAVADNLRAKNIAEMNAGAISKQDLDKYQAGEEEADAKVKASMANLEAHKIDLAFTKVIAPIDGRISRSYVTVGNLIQVGDVTGGTLLTTIVSVDPMYAYFDVDEHTVLRVKKLIREGNAKTPDDEIPVWLGLSNEEGFPHKGTINFVDNQVNPRTGTLKVRGVFPNNDETLSPGYFARVRVPIGVAHTTLLVSDRALDTDQGQKVVFVVEKDDRVASRPVQLGALHDGWREITDGLKPGERVIVNGLQLVSPGMTVKAELVEMPSSKTPTKSETASLSNTLPNP